MKPNPDRQVVQNVPDKPNRYVFVLLDQFTMLCFSCAVEALRIANRMSGQTLYEWVLAGEGGLFCPASGAGVRGTAGALF